MNTFSNQANIPKLPVAPLSVLENKFLSTVRPFLTAEEFEATEADFNVFLKEDAPGLYKSLTDYDKTVENYLHDFWLDSYLFWKASLTLNVNPVFILEDDPTPSRLNQVSRAASLLLSSFKFISLLKKEILSPDVWKRNPLCMAQFKQLFGTARIPTASGQRDEVVTCNYSKHVLVMRKGQFYYFDGLDSDDNPYLTEREICKNLEAIITDSDGSEESPVGVLTSLSRNRWAVARHKLLELDDKNEAYLRVVDSALLVLCLDVEETDVATPSETVRAALHGRGPFCSRWYDKLQIIVSKNGQASVNFEHSVVDGHTVLRFASDIFTDTIVRFAKMISGQRVGSFNGQSGIDLSKLSPRDATAGSSNKTPWSKRNAKTVHKLVFVLDEELRREMRYGEVLLEDITSTLSVDTLEFTGYGKTFIVQSGMSPDAYVQLSIMGAFFILYGGMVNTYESVLTKAFRLGRTEAARSASIEAQQFFRALFIDHDEQDFETLPTTECQMLLKKLHTALKVHSKTTREAAAGFGVDRVLLALKCIQEKHQLKQSALFSSPGYKALCQNTLSTSNCGNPSLRFFGFGPVCEDGLGVGYIIKDESINICVTSWKRRTTAFVTALKRYLERVQDLILEIEPKDFENSLMGVKVDTGVNDATVLSRKPRAGSTLSQDEEGYNFFGENEG